MGAYNAFGQSLTNDLSNKILKMTCTLISKKDKGHTFKRQRL